MQRDPSLVNATKRAADLSRGGTNWRVMTYVQFTFLDEYETTDVTFVGISNLLESFGGFMGAIMGIMAVLARVCMKEKIVGRLRPIIEKYSKDRSATVGGGSRNNATDEFTDEQIDKERIERVSWENLLAITYKVEQL